MNSLFRSLNKKAKAQSWIILSLCDTARREPCVVLFPRRLKLSNRTCVYRRIAKPSYLCSNNSGSFHFVRHGSLTGTLAPWTRAPGTCSLLFASRRTALRRPGRPLTVGVRWWRSGKRGTVRCLCALLQAVASFAILRAVVLRFWQAVVLRFLRALLSVRRGSNLHPRSRRRPRRRHRPVDDRPIPFALRGTLRGDWFAWFFLACCVAQYCFALKKRATKSHKMESVIKNLQPPNYTESSLAQTKLPNLLDHLQKLETYHRDPGVRAEPLTLCCLSKHGLVYTSLCSWQRLKCVLQVQNSSIKSQGDCSRVQKPLRQRKHRITCQISLLLSASLSFSWLSRKGRPQEKM